jgi:putative glutamate/gamma-aminobutyrate antiporter
MSIITSGKTLTVFSLIMINVIAVDSLRALPINALYGFSLVFYYLIGGIFFLIPTALVAAELATGWPATGGIYVWLREAFGKRAGFIIIWLQWLYNIVWYPTIMSFLAATLTYIFAPELATNKAYMVTMVLLMFWGATFANWYGMRVSSWVSTIAALVGTLLPMLFMIVLVSIWLFNGRPSNIDFTWNSFMPKVNSVNDLALLTMVLFSLIGMEMSAVHAGDVKDPQRSYPRALFISAALIIVSLTLASLAISIVIPLAKIQLASGLMDSFSIFFTSFHMPWMIPFIVIFIILGGFGAVSAWVIGPTKGLMIAAADGAAPKFFEAKNKHDVPTRILVLQGVITTILSSAFIFMPTINSAFSLLSAITGQVAIIVYLGIFAAVIKLRYSKPNVKRAYRIPGGKVGLWIVAGLGFILCAIVLVLGFFPPSQIPIGNVYVYETLLIGGVVLICGLPLLYRIKK